MLKLRLKKIGRKNQASYQLVIASNETHRNGAAIKKIGYYNTIAKKFYFNENKILYWLNVGAQPTVTVQHLLKRIGILN
jgi:small subunit ribosomal protein S16